MISHAEMMGVIATEAHEAICGSQQRPCSPAYPRWHDGLKEWVLVIDDRLSDFANVRRANGETWHAAKDLLKTKPENEKLSDGEGESASRSRSL